MTFAKCTHRLGWLLYLLVALSLTACAHSAGSYEPTVPLKQGVSLNQYAHINLEAKNNNEVPMTSYDRERLVNKIVRKLQVANRFTNINGSSPEPNTLFATIQITNYDQGNAFLRFLLAGLGQIHIDGILTLEDRAKSEQLARYDVNKAFAWGGLYGLETKIEDVEEGFVEAVVEITSEKDKNPEGT